MSRANLTVLVERDGALVTLGHSIYNGTTDQWATFIETGRSTDAWDRWYAEGRWAAGCAAATGTADDDWPEWTQRCLPRCACRTDAEPVDVMLYNDYGSGSWIYGIVCLTCMVITDIDVDETWDGRPEAGVAPSRRARTRPVGAIVTTATAADGSEPRTWGAWTHAYHRTPDAERMLNEHAGGEHDGWPLSTCPDCLPPIVSPPCAPQALAGRPHKAGLPHKASLFAGVDPGGRDTGIVFVIRDEPFPYRPQSPELVARIQRGIEQWQENHPDSDPKDGAP